MWGDVPPPTWNKVVQGCVVAAPQGAGRRGDRDVAGGLPPDDAARRGRRPPLRADGPTRLGAADPGRARPCRLRQRRGVGAVAGAGAARARGLGRRSDRGRPARRAAPGRRGGPPGCGACGPGTIGRCWPRRRPGSPRRRCASAGGRCWRWPSTRPAARATPLRTLHQARRMLVAELGIEPGPELVALEQAILRQDPSLVVAAALPEPSAVCPYLGLVPYDVDDTDGFFGRDGEVEACLDRLAAVGVLVVVGPSGSGKSSLVRAGVAAALQRNGRRVVVITPGARPMDALTALPTSGPVPVLVVDQCEEAVTLCDDPAAQADVLRRPRRPRRTWPAGRRPARRPPRRAVGPPGLRPSRRAGAASVERDERGRPAGGDRGSCPSGRPAVGAGPGRSVGARGRGRARRAAAAVARVARDVAAARGSHAHRRRLPGTPVGSEARSPSRPRRSTTRSPPSSGRCCATCSCAW